MQEEINMSEQIGFIGTGNMGQPMAHNLLRAGFDLSVYDINAANLAPLVKQGAYWAFLPGDVVQPGGIVITMVPDDAALLQVTIGEDGIVGRIGSNGVHLSLSTIPPRRQKNSQWAMRSRAAPSWGPPCMADQNWRPPASLPS
jgi:3-hydroxyisobutyrate dehydrogenase-like beta-hydroxyacid dehydrogenase